jgi:hypothetical protein
MSGLSHSIPRTALRALRRHSTCAADIPVLAMNDPSILRVLFKTSVYMSSRSSMEKSKCRRGFLALGVRY